MALVGLLRTGEVRFVTTMSYQAASGAGAQAMLELLAQMRHVGDVSGPHLDAGARALAVEQAVRRGLVDVPTDVFGAPLACSALPWIDRGLANGQTREEWKAQAEASKILGTPTAIDGLCVRIGALRSHAQGLAIHLRRPMPMDEVHACLAEAHRWVQVVPNDKEATLRDLTPAATAGSLTVPIGRLRPSAVGEDVLHAFSVGDQLLWGAAEPLRRMLRLVREHRGQ
jgi:aspartate-semialdehyde dehydrogenase